MNSKSKARHVLSEAISDIQSASRKAGVDMTYTIESLKGLFKHLRDMNPGTVITIGEAPDRVLYHPYAVNVFHIDGDTEEIPPLSIYWYSTCDTSIPDIQTKIGIMRDDESIASWSTVIGWGDFRDHDEKITSLYELGLTESVTIQQLPLDSFDVGMRIITRRLAEINEGTEPQPAKDEVILASKLD